MLINKDIKEVTLINRDVKAFDIRTLTKENWAPSSRNTNRCNYIIVKRKGV